MKKTEKMKLYSERNSLYDEINERFQRIMEIDKSITADGDDDSLKIEYAGKAVKITKNSVTDKTIEIVMYVDKCIYHKGYVTLYGSCIKVVQSEENPSVQFLENTDNNVMLREDDQTYIKVISEDEYNKFVSELCESMKKKTY